MSLSDPEKVGIFVGNAIARDFLAEGYEPVWPGLSPEDADKFVASGLEPESPDWDLAEIAAEDAFNSAMEGNPIDLDVEDARSMLASGPPFNLADEASRLVAVDWLMERGVLPEHALEAVVPVEEEDDGLVLGRQIQYDNSGVGHNWRNIHSRDLLPSVIQELEAEIMEGGELLDDSYVSSGGEHYRW